MKYVNHTIRGASASAGSINANKLYGIHGSDVVRELSPTRADCISMFDSTIKPGCINMIRNTEGTVTKRVGFEPYNISDSVLGFDSRHIYSLGDITVSFYFSGQTMYVSGPSGQFEYTLDFAFENLNSLQLGDYMVFYSDSCYIVYCVTDNKYAYWCEGGTYDEDGIAYIPTIYIANSPGGAGSAYESVNILGKYVAEQYIGDGSSTIFKTHLKGSDFTAYTKSSSGEWKKVTVSSASGNTVTLESAPSKPSVSGEDNVKIVYARKDYNTVPVISSSACATLFGAGERQDRVFLAGGSQYPSRIYYSQMDNPLYIPDLNYIEAGGKNNIVGNLASLGTSLEVITDGGVYSFKASVTSQTLAINQQIVFVLAGVYNTPKPIKNVPSVVFNQENVYLTENGIYAIAPSGILDERCADLRSQRINYHLLQEKLDSCILMVWGDYLVISNRKDTLYLLDSKQITFSGTRKDYECYVWKGIKTKCIWTFEGALYFNDGSNSYVFSQGGKESDYCDVSSDLTVTAIDAYWETPYIYTDDFIDNKFFSKISLLVDSKLDLNSVAMNTSVRVYAKFDEDDWRLVRDYDASISVFKYSNFDYSKVTYKNRVKNFCVSKRLLHKKGRGLKLRFENDRVAQPFTMLRFAVEYMKM